MVNLCVIFGSRSCEHDVSIVSALQMMDAADASKYNVIPVYIDRTGGWYTGAALRRVETFQNFNPSGGDICPCFLTPTGGTAELTYWKRGFFTSGKKIIAHVDVVVPILHGMHGEDGTLQGLLELCGLPYAGCGVTASAMGMDKIAMKLAFRGAGLPVLDAVWIDRDEWASAADAAIARAEDKLGYPVYVKPANLGSSIGIGRADDAAGLRAAVDVALAYDRRVLVERGAQNVMEVNCSALGYGRDVSVSLCETPLSWREFLSFEEKYLPGEGKTGAKSQGFASAKRQIPAPISEDMTTRIQHLTAQAFMALDCRGVARVDFIVDTQTNDVFINEINTIPGSLSFYLWEPTGLSYPRLIDRLVEIAFRAKVDKERNTYSFESPLLMAYGQGAKGQKGGTKGKA